MSLRQRGQRPSEATNEGGYYAGQGGHQTPQQHPRPSPPSSGGSYGGGAGYYGGTPSAGYCAAPAANASGYGGGYPAATPVQPPAPSGYPNAAQPAYGGQGYGQSYGTPSAAGAGGYGGGPTYGGYSGGAANVGVGIGSGGGVGSGANPYQKSKSSSSSGFTVKHVLLSLLAIALLVLTGTAFHYRGLTKAAQLELDNAKKILAEEKDENIQRRKEKRKDRDDKKRAKNDKGNQAGSEERRKMEEGIRKFEAEVQAHQETYDGLMKKHAEHTATLEDLSQKKQDLLKTVDHTRYQLEDAVEETEMYKSMVDGMDEVEKYMKKREGALFDRISLLEGKIARESWREAAEWFGPGPHRVEMEIEYTKSKVGEPIDRATGTLTIEMAPLDLMPHTVNHFLQQVHHSLWDGCSAGSNARHILQLGPSYSSANGLHTRGYHDDKDNDANYDRFYHMGLDKISYQEYNEKYPHEQWTVGLAGRPGGPDFYINKLDNRVIHGPGGQVNEDDLHNEADPCFGRVVDSDDILKALGEVPTIPTSNYAFKDPVKIVSARVMVPKDNPVEGWREIKKGTKLDGQDEAVPMPEGSNEYR